MISASVISITSFQSPNAWYSSIIVNSGLWRVEMPSLRKIRADLEHPLHAADDQPLEVQLEGDAQVQVACRARCDA